MGPQATPVSAMRCHLAQPGYDLLQLHTANQRSVRGTPAVTSRIGECCSSRSLAESSAQVLAWLSFGPFAKRRLSADHHGDNENHADYCVGGDPHATIPHLSGLLATGCYPRMPPRPQNPRKPWVSWIPPDGPEATGPSRVPRNAQALLNTADMSLKYRAVGSTKAGAKSLAPTRWVSNPSSRPRQPATPSDSRQLPATSFEDFSHHSPRSTARLQTIQ